MCRQPLQRELKTSSSKGAPIRVANYPLSVNLPSFPIEKYGFRRHDRQFSDFSLSWWWMWERTPQEDRQWTCISRFISMHLNSKNDVRQSTGSCAAITPGYVSRRSLWAALWGWCLLGALQRCLPGEASQERPHQYSAGRLAASRYWDFSCIKQQQQWKML